MKQATLIRKMKISYGTTYTVFAILTSFSSCLTQTRYAELDCSRDTIIAIPFAKNNMAFMEIHMQGNCNDSFNINGLPLRGGQQIDTIINLEWYTDTASIRYTKQKATSGHLKLKVRM